MNIRLSVFRSALVGGFAAAALLAAQANAASDTTMSVDALAPVRATLMPTVTITADTSRPFGDATMRVAGTLPTAVTLLPTVHVSARMPELAVTELPTVRVVADALPESSNDAVADAGEHNIAALPRIDRDNGGDSERPRATRSRVMPR